VCPAESILDLEGDLELQQAAWERNGLLRSLYRRWFTQIAEQLSTVSGPTVELGSGIGRLRETIPGVTLTDVRATPWTDRVADAQRLPFDDESVANLVLIDVLHHIPHPGRFFEEAQRCLAPGGRIVLLEPYCSPASYRVYRRWHHEATDLEVDPFAAEAQSTDAPLDANQALPTLFFFRRPERFTARWPGLRIVSRRQLAMIAYPLSGGWHRRPLLPQRLLGATVALERLLESLAPLLAFRCLVVLERE
jgi:Methyltransferase domain